MVFRTTRCFRILVSSKMSPMDSAPREPAAEITRRVRDMLVFLGLPEQGAQSPLQLSGGQQQRVALARALVVEPDVLLLDEPLSNLDAKLRVRVRTEIKEIQQTLGKTTILVTHDQEEALSISDRIAVFDAGRIRQIGTPYEVYSRPSDQFTADFVGIANFVPATVRTVARRRRGPPGVGAGLAARSLRCRRPGHGTGGSRCSLRPRRMRLSPEAGREPRPSDACDRASFLGDVRRHHVAVAGSGWSSINRSHPSTRLGPEMWLAVDTCRSASPSGGGTRDTGAWRSGSAFSVPGIGQAHAHAYTLVRAGPLAAAAVPRLVRVSRVGRWRRRS